MYNPPNNNQITILNFSQRISESEYFVFEPENFDLVIFNSYLFHFVNHGDNINEDRISLPWDAELIKKN